MSSIPLRLGRNLLSLDYTSDPTDRATRVMPLLGTIGGSPTFLGAARWKVTNVAGAVITLVDPAGNAGPIAFTNQMPGAYLYHEASGLSYTISSTATPGTVTLSATAPIAIDDYVEFRATSVSGTAIESGIGGQPGVNTGGSFLPPTVTAIATSTKILSLSSPATYAPAIGADSQWVGWNALFSVYVASPSILSSTESGLVTEQTLTVSDASLVMVNDWVYFTTTTPAPGYAFAPSGTVTAVSTSAGTISITRRHGSAPYYAAQQYYAVVYREVSSSTITASSATNQTVTVASVTGWSVAGGNGAIEVSLVTDVGEQPYFLDHPTYVSSVGVKFGTIDRQNLVGVSNLVDNAVLRTWAAGVPTGWSAYSGGISAAPALSQNTDPLYTELGDSSALVTFAQGSPGATGAMFVSPVIPWRTTRVGERFSARMHMLLPEFSGLVSLEMRFGVMLASGTIKTWGAGSDPRCILVPADYPAVLPAFATKTAAGVFIDAVIDGFDITAQSSAPFGQFVRDADLAAATGFVVILTPTQGIVKPFYVDGLMVTQTDVAPDAVSEFGDANRAYQETNYALSLLAPPQLTIGVAVDDLYRANPDAQDAVDQLDLGSQVLVSAADLGILNDAQRVVDIRRNLNVPGDTRITLSSRARRLINLLRKSTSNSISRLTKQVTALQPNPVTNVPPSPTAGSGPTITLAYTIDSTTNIPTVSGIVSADVTSVKFYLSASGYGDASTVRAQSADATSPFVVTGSAVLPGSHYYATAFAYNALSQESALAYLDLSNPAVSGSGSIALGALLTPEGSEIPRDIPILVSDLGGDAVVRGMYDARAKVHVDGSTKLILLEDSRQTVGGRYAFTGDATHGIDCGRCTAFDAASKVTWMFWGSNYNLGTFLSVSTNDGNSPFILYLPDGNLKVLFGNGGEVDFTWPFKNGAYGKVAVVYDGTQSLGSRFSGYYYTYDRSTGTFGSRTALTKVADTVGASMATTTTQKLKVGGWGSGTAYNNPLLGYLDEVRMWVGTALNTTQIDAETLSSSPASPNFQYTFATNANNTGSTSGNDGTPTSEILLVGGNLAFGPPMLSHAAGNRAVYNGTTTITLDISIGSEYLVTGSPGYTPIANGPCDGGATIVASEPITGGTPVIFSVFSVPTGSGSSGEEFLTTYVSGSTISSYGMAAGPSVSKASATRVLHARRAGVTASRTMGLQDGSGVEATAVSGAYTATAPDNIFIGSGPTANQADIVFRAFVVVDGTVTSTQRTTLNTWATTHHGATV